jgi:DNA-binding response OmpR family regulator
LKALVVDDDRILADLLAFTLRKEGFEVIQAHDGRTALERWSMEDPDIIILDINLPHAVPALDGFKVCAKIREESNVPIILLTVRGEEDEIVHGLEMGADDYILKPFSPRQLAARVQAVLRRVGKNLAPAVYRTGGVIFDPARREATLPEGGQVTLTPLESRLLECLCQREGQYVPVDELITQVWGPLQATGDMLRQLVRRLRSKIEQGPQSPILIENLPGMGYGLFSGEAKTTRRSPSK